MSVPAIGAVITPAGFQAVSQQGSVGLSWQITPLTVIYYINRSLDGLTYTNIGSTNSLSYTDSTGSIGTVYYYTIQAGNGTSSSPPTLPLQSVPLNPGQTTLGNIRLYAQQRADRVNSSFFTTQELNTYINQSYFELYDILIQAFGDDYFVASPYSFTTNGTDQLYPLPSDFYKLLGVEVSLSPSDPNSWVSLRQFEFIQRNLWNYPNIYTFYGVTNLRYRLNGNNLYIVPIPTSNQSLRIWYAPRPSQLIKDTDTMDSVSGWQEYIIADVAAKMWIKEETDPSPFMIQKEALLKRITEVSHNRNLSEAQTVSDSKSMNFSWMEDGIGGGRGW